MKAPEALTQPGIYHGCSTFDVRSIYIFVYFNIIPQDFDLFMRPRSADAFSLSYLKDTAEPVHSEVANPAQPLR